MNKELNSKEKLLLKKIISTPEIYTNEINNITNPLLLHSILMNYDWEDNSNIIDCLIENINTDIGSILQIIELISDSQYILVKTSQSTSSINKEDIELCDKAYNRILDGYYKNHEIKFSPYLSKVQLFKLKKYHYSFYQKYILLSEDSGTYKPNTYYL